MTISESQGLLVIDKPKGWSSHDVVAKIKRLSRARKVGHTGTLDPAATGVLVLCLNQATKWSAAICEMGKSYKAELVLGTATDTGDGEGRVIAAGEVPTLKRQDIEEVLSLFEGDIEQTVPLYSAVKVKGRRLYKLARQGLEIAPEQRPRRTVHIRSIQLEDYQADRLNLFIECSKGTYIRSLAEDIGNRLSTHAHLGSLRRQSVGPFTLEMAVTMDDLIDAAAHDREAIGRWIRPFSAV